MNGKNKMRIIITTVDGIPIPSNCLSGDGKGVLNPSYNVVLQLLGFVLDFKCVYNSITVYYTIIL